MSDDSGPQPTRFRRAEIRSLVGLVLVGEIVGIVGAIAAHWFKQEELSKILAAGAATLFFGSLLGGVLSLVVADFDRRRLQRAAQVQFISNVLADLKGVYDSVDRGQTLIKANRSAKTYGDEMKNLIAARVKLLMVIRALDFDERGKPIVNIRQQVERMRDYLGVLIAEFEDNYKDVSRLQRLHEARMTAAVERAAKTDASQAVLPDNEPWEIIKNFSGMQDFIGDEKGYHASFLNPLDEASKLLRDSIRAEF